MTRQPHWPPPRPPQSQPFELQIEFRATLPRIQTAAEKRGSVEDDEPTGQDGETAEDAGKTGEDGSHYGDYGLFGYGNDMEYSGVASVGSLHYSMLTKAMSKIPWKKDSADKIHLRKAVRTWFECTLTHEIAHQWWAIGVGNDSQRHPFVDEALTNWSMAYYFEDRYGPARGREIRDSFLETAFVAALGTEDCKDAPANLPTSGYRDIHQYGMVAYCKGGLFYQKLRELTGDEVFFEALRDYYRQFRGKLADPADLRNIIIAHAPAHRTAIDALYRRWIEGAHGSEDISEPASP